jgi:acetate kinase
MDTAWHQTIPEENYLYAVPYDWYEKYGVRKYGFHGTSFLYTAKRAAVLLGKDPFRTNLIICHLGNGASIDAVRNGCSFDTTMGITPLEGLVMGTRCGDADLAMPFYVMRRAGMSAEEMENALNKKSGLLGICGMADMRDVEDAAQSGNKRAILAMKLVARKVKEYIGGYMANLGRVDALVMTAGIGQFSPAMRAEILSGLESSGIVYDPWRNNISHTGNAETVISTPWSKIPILIIPTDEELVMTEDAYALVKGTYDVHTKFHYSFQDADYVNKGRAEALKEDLKKKPDLAQIIAHP